MKQFNILLVEDEESTRETYRQLLEGAGFRVHAAADYDEALARLDVAIDLALIDVVLQGRSGIEVLREIRRRQPETPAVMISAYADKENVLDALRHGAVDYLEKPVRPDDLLTTVSSWAGVRLDSNLKDRHAALQQLRQSEINIHKAYERLNFVLASTAAVIYAADAADPYHINFISDNVKRMSGFATAEFTGNPEFWLSRIHPDDRDRVRSELSKVPARGENHYEYRFRHKDGHFLWLADHIRLEKNRDGNPELLGFRVDITERKQAEAQIRQMAYYDPLTGLPNRSLFYDRIRQAIARTNRNHTAMAVLFMDLDYFKPINDELGHEYGDRALVEVGRRLRQCVRGADTVARLGGDEFGIILGEISSESAACLVAEKVIAGVGEPMLLRENRYALGISIGICIASPGHDDAESIMRMADNAMYQAKASGRNRYCVYQAGTHGLPDELDQALQLERALRQALAHDEFLVYYQPKVDLQDGRITGIHALLRWNNPDTGLVMPDEFLPLAIKTGLIVPISEWVLQRACSQNRRWQTGGLPVVPVSVNITADQLKRGDFVSMVSRILQQTGLATELLQLEIDESDLLQYGTTMAETLKALDAMGIRITLANFGTGFFSLQWLRALPVHELKIHRSLIRLIGQGDDKGNIVDAIIAIGHILNHRVVVEGVETSDQLGFLRKHEPDGMLGYLTSPPVPADEITAQLQTQRLSLD